MSKVKRVPKNQATLGANDIASAAYNPRSGGHKSLLVGAEIRKKATTGLGAIDASTLTRMAPGTALAIYNNGALAWVTMNKSADGAPTAPSGLTNALPLKANDWTYLNMGENDQIQTSASTVGVYIIEDDTTFQAISDDQSF